MKKNSLIISFFMLWISLSMYSQKGESTFYATMETKDATALKKNHPSEIEILASRAGTSAVLLTEKGAEELHHKVLVHGPGFIYERSKESALQTIKEQLVKRSRSNRMAYTIDQDQLVNQSLNLVNNINIANQIQELENYGTRYHTTSSATQAIMDLKTKWEGLAAGRSDVTVRIVNHTSTNMPSVVMTITGTELPDQYVIIGGHADSTASGNNNNAPGADDNASGISTITEAARVLLDMNFKPKRTIEFMAYAAEEVGLRGSREIAEDYKNRNVNVIGYVQFDMTNYKGSAQDVSISTDTYTNNDLNTFLMQLMDHYNATGTHQITYGTSRCNYGCSDHYSWAQQGYDVSFPFEAHFSEHNPHIHTSNDTFDRSPTPNATHAMKFTKLALEFLIEVAKGTTGTIPTCGTPTGLIENAVTATTASISWSTVNNVQGYEVQYKEASANSWTTITVSTTNATVSNLNSGTTYTIRVRANCQGSNSSYTAINITTQSTVPACDSTSLPYNQGFENGIEVWTQNSDDDNDWDVNSNGTPSTGTGPSSAAEGSNYIYIEASGNGSGYPNRRAILTSPCFELVNMTSPVFEYQYHMQGNAVGNMDVELSEDGGSNWTTIATKSGSQGASWLTETIDLSSYLNKEIRVRFNVLTGSSWQGDIAIDAISIKENIGSTDICEGVAAYNSSTNYQVGDRVTYFGNLYERTSSGWTLIGACENTAKQDIVAQGLREDSEVLKFYPNPIEEGSVTITVSNGLWKKGTIHIVNLKGDIIKEEVLNEQVTKIDVSNMSTGIYFISLTQGVKTYYKRLIKK
ncbi:M20/M25/M40 family metallo-hydrolase [Aquimarina rhabdastrellae]